jgi:hypothetical protein
LGEFFLLLFWMHWSKIHRDLKLVCVICKL